MVEKLELKNPRLLEKLSLIQLDSKEVNDVGGGYGYHPGRDARFEGRQMANLIHTFYDFGRGVVKGFLGR
ncbi:hypothetical protein ABDK00_014690 [Niabella insulamsoli]|uniref:hypothetical protein n=1 Tax=Niabella insulamsoli TaxID=3144874 RepID=UPI0031FC3C44